ncbi:unnamed protein product [Didymodactylos carnosus]|uniref:L-aminoadipate-semialdehyde dehydrogenase-phosphopantetheinyl transferase n=1 Tax=Didymodactylos carnosus TaxID=1234261 RepID=A0A813NWK8_9BILA|nr:unnamed protein product [Didymodactylos carnosus]CAF0745628.1 unnamed protein product [Didymodactylos carnosus]CAF3516329.1 unnamed protein product [Didymodactylos carnosus]CAF3524363.1 unnamed protein product [Didymodactylos carnosus]
MFRFYINCHLWRPTIDEWLCSVRCVPNSEIQRIDRFVFQRDAKFALAGQLLIRYVLSKAYKRQRYPFTIERSGKGRPYIKELNGEFDFNLSHHGQLVAIGATFDGHIGCDTIEYSSSPAITTENRSAEYRTRLFQKKFTENEQKFILNDQNEHVRRKTFHRLWCLKESYVKMFGQGIGFELLRLDFNVKSLFNESDRNQILSDTIVSIDNKPSTHNVRFDEQIIYFNNNQQQIITLCLTPTNPIEKFVELNMSDVIKTCIPVRDTTDKQLWDSYMKKRTS